MKRVRIAFVLLLVVCFTAVAQTPQRRVVSGGPAAPDRAINAEERRQIGVILAHMLDTLYVLPEKGKELAQNVRTAFESGKYDATSTSAALADAVTRDLTAANDRHLNLRYTGNDPSRPPLTIEAWEQRRAEMRAEEASPARSATPRPTREYDRDAIRLTNYGVTAAQVLEGNVGYLKMQGFLATEETRAAIDSAMALMANTDAMIVDVRNCPGGNPDTVSYLASYFFGPEKRVLMNRYHRPSDRNWESTTLDVPGKRMPDADLYVLTGRTGSACESFAFTLQQWGRAKTVGETTGGAGYNNMLVDLGLGLTFSISTGTATHPKTKKGWEAIGVKPDIAVPADRALDAAHAEALRGLAAKATSEPQKRVVAAALQKVSIATTEDAIAAVRALEREWLDAYEKRDAEAMNRIVADDFLIFHSDGRMETKPQLMQMVARPRAAGAPAPKFTTDDVQARVYGDTVILTGRLTSEFTRRDGTTSKSQLRYTDTYVRRNGRWQVVSSHLGNG